MTAEKTWQTCQQNKSNFKTLLLPLQSETYELHSKQQQEDVVELSANGVEIVFVETTFNSECLRPLTC